MSQNSSYPQGSGYPDHNNPGDNQSYGQPQSNEYQPGYQGQPANYNQPSAYQQYGSVYGAAPAAPAPKSQTLGIIGLAVVAVCAVVLGIVSYQVGESTARFMVETGMSDTEMTSDQMANDPRFQAWAQTLFTPIMLGLAVSFAGFVGWIISIVATAQNRGRGWGIAGIILGIIAPIIGFMMMSAGVMPFVSQLGG